MRQSEGARPAASPLISAGVFPDTRALLWRGNKLYASCGYTLLEGAAEGTNWRWREAARFDPVWWRRFTSRQRFTHRFFREGFHALAALDSGHFIAVTPGAIVTADPGDRVFRVTHKILRGTRPLALAADPAGALYWGEYFDNSERDRVHVYGSTNRGQSWFIAYTFPRGTIRHVHNIVYDKWADCFWMVTGDYAQECRIVRVSRDWKNLDVVISGTQQHRVVAVVPAEEAVYMATDTPLEANYIYGFDRAATLRRLAPITSSCLYGCRVGRAIFFSTMIEPSDANPSREATVFGTFDGQRWDPVLSWRKDRLPMRYFQYGNAILPAGENSSGLLAVTPIAVEGADFVTSLWRVPGEASSYAYAGAI
jgi:hypothetical protein